MAAGNTMVGTHKQRLEAVGIQAGGEHGELMRAVRSVRRWVENRVSGDTITAPMVRQMEKNLTRGSDSRMRVAVAILQVAAEKDLQVQDRRTGVGRQQRNWLEEAQAWATEKDLLVLSTKGAVSQAKNRVTQHPAGGEAVCLEVGSGWEGATKGLREAFDRVVTIDKERQTISRKTKADPDFLAAVEQGREREGGIVKWLATRAGVRTNEMQGLWISIPCTEETTAQGLNKGKPHAAGRYAGKKRSRAAQTTLETMVEGAGQATQRYEGLQVCMENPWGTALQHEKAITKEWGPGQKVEGCAYGAPTNKPYRLWMTPATQREFEKVRILPADPQSMCADCKAVPPRKHSKCVVPEAGSKRQRTDTSEANGKASRNRVPWRLARQVGECMRKAYQAEQDQRRSGSKRSVKSTA